MGFVTKRVDLNRLGAEDQAIIESVLEGSPNSTIFHTAEWNRILINRFGLHADTLLATRGGRPAGLYTFFVRDRQCQSPAIHLESPYGGPISVEGENAITPLLRAAERLHRTAAFRIWTPPNYDVSPLMRMGYTMTEEYTSIVGLQGSEEELWAGLRGSARSRVKKARREHVEVQEKGVSSVEEYYKMVVSVLGSRAGISVLPQSFYEEVVGSLGQKGMARLLLAKHDGKFIAGAIFLLYKDTVYYWHGASHREHLKVAPNDLIFWELITWAKRNNFKYYDLVRVETDRLPGIARFKMKFGGSIVPCNYSTKKTMGYKLLRISEYALSPTKAYSRLRGSMAALLSSGRV